MSTDAILRLWGKTKQGSTDPLEFHPALFHMLDVAHVSYVLLSEDSSARWRNMLGKVLNSQPSTLSEWLPYVVALHDIGKISLPFQASNRYQFRRLQDEGFLSNTSPDVNVPHPIVSQIYIEQEILKMTPNKTIQAVGDAHGGHHGWFVDRNILKKMCAILLDEPAQWLQMRKEVDATLQNTFLKCSLSDIAEPGNISAAAMAINGFTILCDWIGSDERYFKVTPDMHLEKYIDESLKRAKQAIQSAGLSTLTQSSAPTDMKSLFFDIELPRPLQFAIDEIPDEILKSPSLTIIEAPTGEGKTEAALTLAHRIAQLTGTDELYYALPTMATSNQMFGRLQEHLVKRLGLDIPVKLVHGQSALVEEDMRADTLANLIEPMENGDEDGIETMESVAWFNAKKRPLLAPFGVGTVDQAELAALNVKHVGLRMVGLAGKVVIIDEVHAYDTYMTTVIARLLKWLSAMNTSVILLSATLPTSRRQQLADAYCKNITLDERANFYPCLLVVSNNPQIPVWMPDHAIDVWQPKRKIEIQSLHFSDDDAGVRAKAEWLLDKISEGGCVCWITNTVRRAQDICREVAQRINSLGLNIDLALLHSQFPLEERQRLEEEIKENYGREGVRPFAGIVIGTQVLEQSLDLDFDLMVSDLAPVDLLLQRAGRLHRHERKNRSAAHDKPRLWANFELDDANKLKKGSDKKIYSRYIMLQTLHALTEKINSKAPIALPADYRVLIESVYTDQAPPIDSPLYDDWLELKAKRDLEAGEAKDRLIPEPHPRDSFARTVAPHPKFDEDEQGSAWIAAKTRLGEETLNIIPLERDGDWVYFGQDGEKISVNAEAPLETQRKLLLRNMRVSRPDAIEAIRMEAEKRGTVLFKKSVLLKSYCPLWLSKGETTLPIEKRKLHIMLDSSLGLVIEKGE